MRFRSPNYMHRAAIRGVTWKRSLADLIKVFFAGCAVGTIALPFRSVLRQEVIRQMQTVCCTRCCFAKNIELKKPGEIKFSLIDRTTQLKMTIEEGLLPFFLFVLMYIWRVLNVFILREVHHQEIHYTP